MLTWSRGGWSLKLGGCRSAAKRSTSMPLCKRVSLCLESLEDRTQLSPFTSTGVLGDLMPIYEVAFNTTAGTYRVDNGPWHSGGVLSPDPHQTTMLYSFGTIRWNSSVIVSAGGLESLCGAAVVAVAVAVEMD